MMNNYLGIGGLLLGACTSPMHTVKDLPNIVIILADDLGWGDVGFHNTAIKTPNIDKLASEGIILNRFYSAPMSSPTRAGLMTGRYQDRYGLRHVVIRPWFDYGLDPGEKTMPEFLEEAGYVNRGLVGKWHLGHSRAEYHPLRRGFTDYYGCYNGAIDYFTHEREGELDWHNGYESSYDIGYSTDLITKKAIEYINRYRKNSPFFLYVAYNAPHSPLEAQEEYLIQYGYDKNEPSFGNGIGQGNTRRQTFTAMVTNMDAGIGEILKTLEEHNISDNTIVLFFSDNGAEISFGGSSGELRGRKLTEWEGGMRVPAVIKWPSVFKGGRVSDQVTGCVDVLPTLLDAVNFKKTPEKKFDGMSILPVLKGEKDKIERDLYLGSGAVVNSEWKLVKKDAKRILSFIEIEEDMLFRISADPNETTNVRDQYPDVYNELLEKIRSFETIVPSMTPPPDSKPKDFVAPHEWEIILIPCPADQ